MSEAKFFLLLQKAIDVNYNLSKIVKKDKEKQQKKRDMLKGMYTCIHNPDIIKMGLIIYKKNSISKILFHQLLKYYIKSFEQHNEIEEENDEIFNI